MPLQHLCGSHSMAYPNHALGARHNHACTAARRIIMTAEWSHCKRFFSWHPTGDNHWASRQVILMRDQTSDWSLRCEEQPKPKKQLKPMRRGSIAMSCVLTWGRDFPASDQVQPSFLHVVRPVRRLVAYGYGRTGPPVVITCWVAWKKTLAWTKFCGNC